MLCKTVDLAISVKANKEIKKKKCSHGDGKNINNLYAYFYKHKYPHASGLVKTSQRLQALTL